MKIEAILLDLNGTLIDIRTDETDETIYWELSKFLLYYEIDLTPAEIRTQYFSLLHRQLEESPRPYPEFDAVKIFGDMLAAQGKIEIPAELPQMMARLYRSLSLRKLDLYAETAALMEFLSSRYRLAAVTDGQSLYARAEMRYLGLEKYFPVTVVSGDLGFRKPDPGMYKKALQMLNVSEKNALFVGNDLYHDVWGAEQAGIRAVMFYSNQGRTHMENYRPAYWMDNLARLPQILRQLEQDP